MPEVYSTGRGGAGNIHKGIPAPSDGSDVEVPKLTQKVYTTGRGGAGNMRSNTDPQVTRESQDVELGKQLSPVASPSIGRGGYGNVRAGQRASLSLFEKAKNLFKGSD